MEVKFGPDLGYFLWSLALGLALAAGYDILRFSRRIIRTADIVVNIEDILFIIMSGGLIVAEAYLINNGIFRIYSLISAALGFAVYRFILKDRLVRLLAAVYSGLCRAVKFAARILLFPLRLAVRIVGKPLIVTVGSAAGKMRRRAKKRVPETDN